MEGTPGRGYSAPPLVGFFGATFVLTWVFWVPSAVLFGERVASGPPWASPMFVLLQTVGAAVPSGVAYWLLRRRGGREAVDRVVERYKVWRVGWRWYLLAAFLVPAIQLAGLVIGGVLRGEPIVEASSPLGEMLAKLGVAGAIAVFPVTILAQLPSSPLLEEFGWRGFALPRLQDRYSALTSSLILGLLWGLWHLPLTLAYGDSLLPFLLRITAVTVLMTWVFNNTQGSMLPVMLFHASLNASIVPLSSEAGRWPGVVLLIAVATVVVACSGSRDLAARPRSSWSRLGSAQTPASRVAARGT